jgi:hypothetical protein
VAALAGAATLRHGRTVDAQGRCIRNDRSCLSNDQCCSGLCASSFRRRTRVCTACASEIVCGDICCPADAVNACSTIQGPNGPVPTCLCPCESVYDPVANACVPLVGCETDGDCCSGRCCDGVCCAEGEVCCGGACTTEERCVCPAGTACSGDADMSYCDVLYSTAGTCCPYPQEAFACSDSAPGAGDGFAICCVRDRDCPPCPSGSWAYGFPATLGCAEGDCCTEATPGADVTGNIATCCVREGLPCQRGIPCCLNGECVSDVCT